MSPANPHQNLVAHSAGQMVRLVHSSQLGLQRKEVLHQTAAIQVTLARLPTETTQVKLASSISDHFNI